MEEELKRPIRTCYYFGRDLLHTNCAKNANRAVMFAVDHMQKDHYGASVAEVYDETDGTLHCVLKNERKDGLLQMRIIYKREVEDDTQ